MLLASAAVCAPHGAAAQQGPPQPVTWSLALEPAPVHVAAGGTLTAVVTAAIDENWHVYAPDEANAGPRPVELTIVKNPVFTAAGKFEAPEPEREMDEAFGQSCPAVHRRGGIPAAGGRRRQRGRRPARARD